MGGARVIRAVQIVDLREAALDNTRDGLIEAALDGLMEYRAGAREPDALVVRHDQAERLKDGRHRLRTLWGMPVWVAPEDRSK